MDHDFVSSQLSLQWTEDVDRKLMKIDLAKAPIATPGCYPQFPVTTTFATSAVDTFFTLRGSEVSCKCPCLTCISMVCFLRCPCLIDGKPMIYMMIDVIQRLPIMIKMNPIANIVLHR